MALVLILKKAVRRLQKPRQGAHGTTVAFLHPRWLDGVLAELVEDR